MRATGLKPSNRLQSGYWTWLKKRRQTSEPVSSGNTSRLPQDIENENPNFIGGDCVSGSHHLGQNFFSRPLLGWSNYATPIEGLYMIGASTWPGGGVNAGSGYLLARKLIETT